MRVLLFGPYPPPHGGVQTNVVDLHDHLREHGARADVVNLTRHRRVGEPDVHYPRGALEVLGLLLRLRYEIIHLHVGGELHRRELLLGIFCSLLPWARTVFTFHSGGYPTSEKGRRQTKWSLCAVALRRFDAVIAVNEEIAEFVRRLGVAPDRVRVISPASLSVRRMREIIDADRDGLLPADLRAFIAAHRPFLLTVGLLEPEYDLEAQIDTLESIRRQHPDAGLVVVGDGSLREELRRYVAAKPYAEHVWVYGDLPHLATMRAIVECDLLLRTTLYDGDAISVREALHFGTPVIATDTGMRPAGVDLVPISDRQALVAAILAGLAEPRRREPLPGDDAGLEAVVELYEELL